MSETHTPLCVVLELQAKPGERDALVGWFDENLADTRAQDGCVGVEAYVDSRQPDAVVVVQYWRDRDAHKAYGRWRSENGSLAGLLELLGDKPATRILDPAAA